jgi:hypothetical protein
MVEINKWYDYLRPFMDQEQRQSWESFARNPILELKFNKTFGIGRLCGAAKVLA